MRLHILGVDKDLNQRVANESPLSQSVTVIHMRRIGLIPAT